MYMKKKISALLLLGGSGSRFGSSLPKQFHRLSGKKIYFYALEALIQSSLFDEILLVCHKDWKEEIAQETKEWPFIRVVEGGNTRQESSYRGLLQCSTPDLVLIHDGVRPFVSQRILFDNMQQALLHGAVDTCIASFDTIIHSEDQLSLTSIPERKTLLRGQTPQTFSYPLILSAHKRALEKNLCHISDDCRLVVEMGKKVFIVPGEETNIKITSPLDLFLAEQILRLHPQSVRPHSMSLKDKHYLVIGGSGGIGQQISSFLKKEGAIVSSASKSGSLYPLDLRDPKSIESFFSSFHQRFGPIDGLIHSAGYLKVKPLSLLSYEEMEEMIQVNFTGLVYSCKLAQIKEKGHIINIASSSFSRGRKEQAIYSASKAAVVNFTQALAEERPSLFVNALIPQRTQTPMRKTNFPNENPSELLSPEEVAKALIDLLKNSLTGSILEVKKQISLT
jgi:ribitol-5-phosphate 2-dehydrogenase (NADP+) / D-ribitol-5-phosphate cytidylyltransferase